MLERGVVRRMLRLRSLPPFHIPYRTPTPSLITWCGGTVGGKGGGGPLPRPPPETSFVHMGRGAFIYNKKKGGAPIKGGLPPFKLRLKGGRFRPPPPPLSPFALRVRERGRGGRDPPRGGRLRNPPPLSCVARALHGWRTLRGRVSSAKLGERYEGGTSQAAKRRGLRVKPLTQIKNAAEWGG